MSIAGFRALLKGEFLPQSQEKDKKLGKFDQIETFRARKMVAMATVFTQSSIEVFRSEGESKL